MATTIANTSKQAITYLIREKFDSLTNVWEEQERKALIQTAKDYGLNDLATEMENDL